MKTIDFFRAVDDSDLDVYEVRYLIRVWRRGACWESPDSIAATTGTDRATVYRKRKKLVEAGWLRLVEIPGHIAYEVAIPDVVNVAESDNEPVVIVAHSDKAVAHSDKAVAHSDTLPIKRTTLNNPLKSVDRARDGVHQNGTHTPPEKAPVNIEEQQAKQRAWEATVELIEFWETLTRRRHPPQDSADFRDLWLKPFNTIWIACGRDVAAAKAKIQAVRDGMLADGLTIFNPAKLPAHVQALADAELIPMTQRLNGNGHRPNFKNDPEAREAHNRQVLDEVFREIQSGGLKLWQ